MEQVQKSSIFWLNFAGLEAREGFSEIIVTPAFAEHDIRKTIKNVLDTYFDQSLLEVIEHKPIQLPSIQIIKNMPTVNNRYQN